MDCSCITLTCLLLMQMIITLIMLNPMYDVQKVTNYIDHMTSHYKRAYFLIIGAYFTFVIYLGMYIPLQNIQILIFSSEVSAYDKLVLLSRIEKNYIIAGFSLFMVVVVYGTRALLAYTASLALLAKKSSEALVIHSKKYPEDILPNLLRVKRSISYEAVLCPNELKEHLKTMMKSIDLPATGCALSSLLETPSVNQNL